MIAKSMAFKQRVCILADYPAWLLPGCDKLPARAGHATWLHMLRPYFAALGDEFEIHWIVMTKGLAAPMTLELDSQTFHLLPRKKKLIAMATGYVFESMAIMNMLREIGPNLIHAWGSEDAYAMTAARICKIPTLLSLQGSLTECLKVTDGGALMKLQALYERHALRRLTRGTGESERACVNMREIHPGMKTSVVDYGVAEVFHKVERQPSDQPRILFVGGVCEAKGIRDLIHVMACPGAQDLLLEVLGSGPDLQKIRPTSGPNVVWHGQASREQVLAALARTWALVIPTHCDTGPTVVKEARAAGVPVITTAAAGAARHIEEGMSGYVIAPGDRSALERAILGVCANRERMLAMGLHGLETVRSQLRGETTVREFAAIYREMCP